MFIRKTIKTIFLLSLISYLLFLFWHPKLPSQSSIYPDLLFSDPIQTPVKDKIPYLWKIKDQTYRIVPLFEYSARGLVVSEYDAQNWLDFSHKKDPAQTKDLCLIWGTNIQNGIYRDLQYKHGEFTCYIYWDQNQSQKFNGLQFANNHLIPKNGNLAKLIKSAHIGDQVKITGQLVNYEILDTNGKIISTRDTSTIRDDQGCEIILVSNFEMIQKGFPYLEIKQLLSQIVLITGVLNFILFLSLP